MVKYIWADLGPGLDECPNNPNENCFSLCVLAADYNALADEIESLRAQRDKLADDLAAEIREGTKLEARLAKAEGLLARAEGVLRVIAATDYRGNRSTESMAAQAYFDAVQAKAKKP